MVLPLDAEPGEPMEGSYLYSYGQISDDHHPIRGCLESLKSLEVVRIIEGEK